MLMIIFTNTHFKLHSLAIGSSSQVAWKKKLQIHTLSSRTLDYSFLLLYLMLGLVLTCVLNQL